MSDFSNTRDELGSRAAEGTLPTGSAPLNLAQELSSLMRRYQTEDAEAGALLVEKASGQLYQYFLAHVRNVAHAEDLLQDFWLRIHNARHTFRVGEPVLPWLYAIAHRVRIDDYRRNRRRLLEDQLDEQLPYRSRDETPQAQQSISELLKCLPASQREAILMMKVSGLSLEEVARATGSTVGAVKQKVHRGYERLRGLMGGRA